MPFSGGVFSRTYTWATEALSPPIAISKLDVQEEDLAAGLSACLLRDGSGLPTAAQDFNNQHLTNVNNFSVNGAATVAGTLAVTGAVTLSAALTVNGAVSSDNTTADEIGYKGIPQNSQSANYTLVLTDAGKHIVHPSGGGAGDTFTIPANASVAYPIGTALTFVNLDSNSVSIAITTDTMTIAGTTSTGTRTLAQNGIATAIKVTSTGWLITGTGLS